MPSRCSPTRRGPSWPPSCHRCRCSWSPTRAPSSATSRLWSTGGPPATSPSSGSPAPTARPRPPTSSSRGCARSASRPGSSARSRRASGTPGSSRSGPLRRRPTCTPCSPSCGRPARPTSSWRSPATRSRSTASTARSSTSPSSPTSPRTTSTSTRRWRTTSAPRRRSSPPRTRGVESSASTTSGAPGWPARRRSPSSPSARTSGPRRLGRAAQGLAAVHPRRPGRDPCSSQCHLPGDFNVVNTALAAVCLLELGHPLDRGRGGAAARAGGPGPHGASSRHRPDADRDPRCVVDYAHTPDAVEAALRALRPSTPGRLVVVLGAGGDRDRGSGAAMGAAAAVLGRRRRRHRRQPALRGPGRHPVRGAGRRHRRPRPRRPSGPRGPQHPRPARSRAGRGEAIAEAVQLARRTGRAPDNTVLVLGKGHETGQEIGGVVHAFDDREALRAALDGLVYRPEASP